MYAKWIFMVIYTNISFKVSFGYRNFFTQHSIVIVETHDWSKYWELLIAEYSAFNEYHLHHPLHILENTVKRRHKECMKKIKECIMEYHLHSML